MISQVKSFLCPDKQGTLEEGRRIQRPKRCKKDNKDEDNSPKTLTDKLHIFQTVSSIKKNAMRQQAVILKDVTSDYFEKCKRHWDKCVWCKKEYPVKN